MFVPPRDIFRQFLEDSYRLPKRICNKAASAHYIRRGRGHTRGTVMLGDDELMAIGIALLLWLSALVLLVLRRRRTGLTIAAIAIAATIAALLLLRAGTGHRG
jgi:hypothetical protein